MKRKSQKNRRLSKKQRERLEKYRGEGWVGTLFDYAGDLLSGVGSYVEPVTREIAWSVVKNTGKVVISAPLTSFLALAATNPVGAFLLACKIIGGVVTVGTMLYNVITYFSPSARERRAIEERMGAIQEMEIKEYAMEVSRAAQQLTETNDVKTLGEVNLVVSSLLSSLQNPTDVKSIEFVQNFRHEVLLGGPDSMVLRIALMQSLSIKDEASGKFYDPNFSMKEYKKSTLTSLKALQRLVFDDVREKEKQQRTGVLPLLEEIRDTQLMGAVEKLPDAPKEKAQKRKREEAPPLLSNPVGGPEKRQRDPDPDPEPPKPKINGVIREREDRIRETLAAIPESTEDVSLDDILKEAEKQAAQEGVKQAEQEPVDETEKSLDLIQQKLMEAGLPVNIIDRVMNTLNEEISGPKKKKPKHADQPTDELDEAIAIQVLANLANQGTF